MRGARSMKRSRSSTSTSVEGSSASDVRARSKRPIVAMVIVGVVVVLVGTGWYLGIYAPVSQHIATTQSQVNVEQAQMAADRAQLAQLIQDKRDAPHLRAELSALTKALPVTFSLADFIDQADAAAAQAGVPLLQITPAQPGALATTTTGGTATVAGVSAITFSAEASGTFVALMHFLHALDHLQELVNVGTVQLSALAAGGTNPKINLSFTGTVYYRS